MRVDGPPAPAWRPALRAWLPVVGVLLVAAAALRQPALSQRFTIDESRWISTSRYFWTTLVDRELFGPAWQPNYLVLTHPPVARYAIGFGLWLEGWRPEQLNGRYDNTKGQAFNRVAGNIPGPDLLAAARRVTFVFALGAVVVLYGIGHSLAGTGAGLAAAGLALVHPLLSTLWTRALAESILAFFSLLALLLALRCLPRSAPRPGGGPPAMARRPLIRGATTMAVVGGLALGLAAATKLSGVLGGIGLVLFALCQQSLAWWRHRHLVHPGRWAALAATTAFAFVLVNPLLYPDPIGRTAMLFQHRREEMEQQRRVSPRLAVPTELDSRAHLVGRRLFQDYSLFHRQTSLPIDPLLVAAGVGVALAATARELRSGDPGGHALLLCWGIATYVVSTLNFGYDSSHYFAPLAAVNVVLQALALAAAASWLSRQARRPRRGAAPRSVQPNGGSVATPM